MGSRTTSTGTRRWKTAAVALAWALALVAASFVAAWWLIGDRSYDGPVEGGLDYAFKAPDLPPAVTAVAGIVGGAVTVAALWWLGTRARSRGPAAALVVVGAFIAFSARVMTAGVIGANIGAGLAVLVVLPLAAVATLGLLVVIVQRSRRRG